MKRKSFEQMLKETAKRRDDFTCQHCGFVGKNQFERNGVLVWVGAYGLVEADHIIPKRLGGETSLRNLQTLCKKCHKKKTKKDLKKIAEARKNGII